MPLPSKAGFTSDDYWGLPEDKRAKLIDGGLYDMAPPSRTHQRLAGGIYRALADHVDAAHGLCKVYIIAPFAVNLRGDDTVLVEPDVTAACDRAKLSDQGCEGAPNMAVEVVSPSEWKRDYSSGEQGTPIPRASGQACVRAAPPGSRQARAERRARHRPGRAPSPTGRPRGLAAAGRPSRAVPGLKRHTLCAVLCACRTCGRANTHFGRFLARRAPGRPKGRRGAGLGRPGITGPGV